MTSLNILVVDDDKVDRESVKRYLTSPNRQRELNIQEAETGKQAMQILSEQDFDCVFLDYQLPDIDGISLLRKLYNPDLDLAQSPVVMLTGQGSESVMLDALRWGTQDYLIKNNITPDTLNIAMTKAKEIFELKKGRKQAEEELHQSRKMEAIGQLSSGIAHDFNNLLTVVLGNTRLLRKRLQTEIENLESRDDILQKVQSVETAAKKGADLVRRLMIFTRQRSLAQEPVNINGCIRETFELLKRTLGETIQIDLILAEDLALISADVSQFENMLINMAVNARDAMPQGGKLTIETSNIDLDESYTLRHPDVIPGGYVLISISDTGTGMSHQTARRIFEPFFTTKGAGEGTGLGLSMVYGFTKQSGGHIHVYSEEGHGTVFRVYMPKMKQDSAHNDASRSPLPTGDETVLVAEDDDAVRDVAIKMLHGCGYKTLQASNGRAALEILKHEHKNIDLIFTDIVMPSGLNGIQLVEKAREYYPGIKVLYTSGYTENAIPNYQLCVGEELISKPYRKETLARKVRKVLDN